MEQTRVLICEDEQLFAKDLESRLISLGFEVAGVASNSEEAISLAKNSAPDLALMDIRLDGELSGIDVAKILDGEYRIPSVYLSAYTDKSTMEQVRTTKPLGFLSKPVADHDLRSVIDFGIQNHRQRSRLEKRLIRMGAEIDEDESLEVEEGEDGEGASTAILPLINVVERACPTLLGVTDNLMPRVGDVLSDLEWLGNSFSLRDYERRQTDRACQKLKSIESFLQQLTWVAGCGSSRRDFILLDSLIGRVTSRMESAQKGKAKIITVSTDNPVRSFVDKRMVEEALTQLILNAEEASLPDGLIQVAIRKEYRRNAEIRSYRIESDAGFACISITDNGRGINASDIYKIFQPFYSTRMDRVGLGLSLAMGVAYMHDGWIELSSAKKVGTTVTLVLPAA